MGDTATSLKAPLTPGYTEYSAPNGNCSRPQVAGAYFRCQFGQPLRPSDVNSLRR